MVTGLGLLMLAFTLGFGPALFPGYKPGPEFKVSDTAKAISQTRAKIVTANPERLPQPEKTWRNYVSAFFMLEPMSMVSVPPRERTELQALQDRAQGKPGPGEIEALRRDR